MKRAFVFILMLAFSTILFGQTIKASSDEIADQLDLSAVVDLFGNSNSVEEFEKSLNSATVGINNLDLNGDGNVDYLRCIESVDGSSHYILIQDCLATNIYQDIATIYVDRDVKKSAITTQIIGNEYFYGKNYVIEPVYVYHPAIYSWFWGPNWIIWNSPFYWDYYPGWYVPYTCVYYSLYVEHMHLYHAHHCCVFNHPPRPHHHYGPHWQHHGYADNHPHGSFNERHGNERGINNHRDLGGPSRNISTSRGNMRLSDRTPNGNQSRSNFSPASRGNMNNSSRGTVNNGNDSRSRGFNSPSSTNRSYSPSNSSSRTQSRPSFNSSNRNLSRSTSSPSRSVSRPSSSSSRSSSSFSGSRPSGGFSGSRSSGSSHSSHSSSGPRGGGRR